MLSRSLSPKHAWSHFIHYIQMQSTVELQFFILICASLKYKRFFIFPEYSYFEHLNIRCSGILQMMLDNTRGEITHHAYKFSCFTLWVVIATFPTFNFPRCATFQQDLPTIYDPRQSKNVSVPRRVQFDRNFLLLLPKTVSLACTGYYLLTWTGLFIINSAISQYLLKGLMYIRNLTYLTNFCSTICDHTLKAR